MDNKFLLLILQKKRSFMILLLIMGILGGFLLYKDYGASWDEPEYYEYADSIVHAYSIKDLLKGNYNLESSLGPVDLRLYGPAYLLFGKALFIFFKTILPSLRNIEVWHLLNYLFYLLGTLFFFKIASKLVNPISAAISSLLFSTQPVLFGSSWINPKDIPFMVIFLGTVYFGMESINLISKIPFIKGKSDSNNVHRKGKQFTKFTYIFATILILITGLSFVFGFYLSSEIKKSILNLFLLENDNFFRVIFTFFGRNVTTTNIDLYAAKAISIFLHIRMLLLVMTCVYVVAQLIPLYFPGLIHCFWQRVKELTYQTFKFIFKWNHSNYFVFFLACLFLGASISTRVIGPFAGSLIFFYGIIKYKGKAIPYLFIYGVFSILIAFALWPYLWAHPIKNFIGVLSHMADNPVIVNVLFSGKFYGSNVLPPSYLPTLLLVTLTEIVPFFFFSGLITLLIYLIKNKGYDPNSVILILAWFFIPFVYVICFRPPLYDNYRHFLFIVPPLFLIASFGIEKLMSYLKPHSWKLIIGLGILLPGILGIVSLHPYEYSYYNSFVGGIEGASEKFEIDYWNTCYKNLTEQINDLDHPPEKLIVASTPNLVGLYLDPQIDIEKMQEINYPSNSLILLHYRWEYLKLFPDYPITISVKILDTLICDGKLVP